LTGGPAVKPRAEAPAAAAETAEEGEEEKTEE